MNEKPTYKELQVEIRKLKQMTEKTLGSSPGGKQRNNRSKNILAPASRQLENLTLIGKGKLLIVAVCLILLSGQARAAAGWTSYGSVAELNVTTAGRFLVRIDVASNPSDCSNKKWFYRDYATTGADFMFRTLLGAVTSGKKVRVYVTGLCDINGYSEITSVSIAP